MVSLEVQSYSVHDFFYPPRKFWKWNLGKWNVSMGFGKVGGVRGDIKGRMGKMLMNRGFLGWKNGRAAFFLNL